MFDCHSKTVAGGGGRLVFPDVLLGFPFELVDSSKAERY